MRRKLRDKRVTRAMVLTIALFVASAGQANLSSAAPSPAELAEARERLMELERDFELVVERYNLVHENLTAIQSEMAAKRLVIDEIEKRMDAKQGAAIDVATELYKSGGSAIALESVLTSESFNEVETRMNYLRSSEAAQLEVFEKLAVDQDQLERNLADLEEARSEAMAAEERLDGLREQIDARLVEQRDEVDELNAAIEAAERRAEARRQAALEAAQESAPSTPVSQGPTVSAPNVAAPNAAAERAVQAALSQQGKPYQWGASGPNSYDCSGLTMWAWAQAGVSLPHNSGAQYAATPRVDRSEWAPGDLLFFGSPIHHVAMYIGNGQMVEAPYTGNVVRVVSASRSDYVGAGRPGV